MLALNMTLFYVLTHSFTLWPDAYECPENSTTTIIYRPILGVYFLSSGIIFIILYIPCFIAISKKLTRAPVYQLMFALAICDIATIVINSIVTGIFELRGVSFCDYPLTIFCLGVVASEAWMIGNVVCILLAIERCVEVNPKFSLEFVFRPKVYPLVLLLLTVYAIYCFLFIKPVLFSLEYGCWFFDPFVGKDPTLYQSLPHSILNFAVATFTTSLYIYLTYHLLFQFGYSTSMWLYKSKHQILFQAIGLCIFHAATALIYEYMLFVSSPPVLVTISQIAWQWSSGAVCLTYLAFNRTIRNSVLKMMIPTKLRAKFGIHIGFDEHLAVETAAANALTTVNGAGAIIKFDNYVL